MATVLPKIRFRDTQIEMAHGAGGKASRRLVEGLFAPLFFGTSTEALSDAAHLNINGARIAITADSFVVKPLRFAGGSIGDLAINGTVNDLAVSGARAQALVVTYILEAGLPTEILEAEVRAMAKAAERAGVSIVGGDTKVVENGKADRMYITTAGVGVPIDGIALSPASVRPGDKVLLSGPIGDHGITILLARGDLDFEADLRSDTRSVLPLVEAIAKVAAPGIRWMRDPTRGGVATALNEVARDCGLGILLSEETIPIRDAVRGCMRVARLWTRCTSPTKVNSLRSSRPDVRRSSFAGAARGAGRTRSRHHRKRRRAAGRDRARHHQLWRHSRDRYAGGRSRTRAYVDHAFESPPLAPRILSRIATNVLNDFFARKNQPQLLAIACQEMSDRFLKGGHLLAFGRGPYATDAQHVSVEFVHPVIVGKRALPALDLSMAFGAWLDAILRPEDIVMGFGPPDGDAEVQAALRRCRRRLATQ